jgi:hypothetical protein
MSGCGEEDGFPPVLTDVRYQSPSYLAGFRYRGSYPLMTGVVSFEDPDGDVVLLTVRWQDCGRDPVNKFEIVQDDLRTTKVGDMDFRVLINTDCPPGDYEVRLSATDGRGYTSNVLKVPYEIYP